MAETFEIPSTTDKNQRYQQIYNQTIALLTGESNQLANMANMCAILKYGMGFFWVGFYLVEENELVLGPFQGTVACTRIAKGKGVCGTAWVEEQTILVENVDHFPGHIACSSLSKSEIVVPLFDMNNKLFGVLDVDSDKLNDFDEIDQHWLELMGGLIQPHYSL
ncbi:MAG TPA: GAF domain-containing protein [Bacteroidia bacterium]|nr:GAF domain-containing protein [Bacteroidia bacterium]